MIKVRDLLRLKHEQKLGSRAIGRSCNLSKSAVNDYLRLASARGLQWPLPPDLDDEALEKRLAPDEPPNKPASRPLPDLPIIHQELKRKGVTLALLWEEYRQAEPETGYAYSQYCRLYRIWAKKQSLSMRQVYKAGEKLFVDYSGGKAEVVNPDTGKIREVEIFVAVLGASGYTYAEATWSQQLSDWLGSHVRAFQFFGGVPELLVPDNLKSAVSKACRYEPLINPSTLEMARYYGAAVLPARPYKPRDKSKAELGVLLVQRWILARLRHEQFFSLSELNGRIRELLTQLNNRQFKKIKESRRSLFEKLDRPVLKPLPAVPWEYGQWSKGKAHIDYHIQVEDHLYSVPYTLVGETLDIRISAKLVEFMHKGRRVACHMRSYNQDHKPITLPEHMPAAHRKHMEWSPGRFLQWGNDIGPRTRDVVRHLLENRPHPEHGYRSCLGLLSLTRKFGKERLEAACQRAMHLNAPNYRSVQSILQTGRDRLPLPIQQKELFALPSHENIRGPHYYH